MHDITKSSNPDTQVLLKLIEALAIKVMVLEAQFASLPEAFVVPGPNGETPKGTVVECPSSFPDENNHTPGQSHSD